MRWSRERGLIIKEDKIEIENFALFMFWWLLPILLIGLIIGGLLRPIAYLFGRVDSPW
jgi:hypothetical protein